MFVIKFSVSFCNDFIFNSGFDSFPLKDSLPLKEDNCVFLYSSSKFSVSLIYGAKSGGGVSGVDGPL